MAIMRASAAIATRWDYWLGAGRANLLAQWVAIVSLVGHDIAGLEAFLQDLDAGHIASFAFGQMQLDRLPIASDRDVDFRAETATGSAQSCGVLPPFCARRMSVRCTIVESSSRFDNSASPPSVSGTRLAFVVN